MKIIIMGCGRVGSQVSQLLVHHGHEVTVIDHDDNAPATAGRRIQRQDRARTWL